jgi:hypothetical protein
LELINPFNIPCTEPSRMILMTYKASSFCPTGRPITLTELKHLLRSEELLPRTRKIDELKERLGYDHPDVKAEKLGLPTILPSVVIDGEQKACRRSGDYQYLGVIQLDIDRKDNPAMTDSDSKKIKEFFASHPACVYTYLSPRGGVKAALATDTARQLHGETANLLIKTVRVLFGVISDTGTCSPFLGSLLCYDEEAWVSDAPIVMPIKNLVRLTLPGRVNRRPHKEGPDQVLTILSKTPRSLPWAERRVVNFRCFEVSGEAALPILIEHWEASDKKKLRSDLRSQLNYITKRPQN